MSELIFLVEAAPEGGYTARAANGRRNPGEAYIRLAIVHDEAILSAAFERIRRVL